MLVSVNEASQMEDPNRKVLIDKLTHKLRGTEKRVAKIRFAMKTSVSVRRLRRLVTELRTARGNRDALESQLARLHFPIPLFWPL
jgi:predicted  nucleic acid-binding Zn-ribbon protein